jgi:holo-[acyl-carrier protein] synthase
VLIGVGIDIVNVNRFEAKLQEIPNLKEKIFSVHELEKSSFQTLAGKFAAKEALIKALNYSDKSLLKSLEVLNSDCGKPYFNFRINRPKVLRDLAIHLSISHDVDLSCAFVVIESL